MTPTERDHLLISLEDIAIRAGRAILDIYESSAVVAQAKADGSPVTAADRRAEAIILEGLAQLAPAIPVVAEEEVAAGRAPPPCERFFLVDPLDGTREFLARNGEFTVNIALVEEGRPIAGVIHAPVFGEIFAGSGESASRAGVRDGAVVRREAIRVRCSPSSVVALVSRSHASGEECGVTGVGIERFEAVGSSLKFCRLAAGEADLYPRLGRTMEWDTAAGHAILHAAGGRLVRPDGTEFLYGKRGRPDEPDFANGAFLATGDPALLDKARIAATPTCN